MTKTLFLIVSMLTLPMASRADVSTNLPGQVQAPGPKAVPTPSAPVDPGKNLQRMAAKLKDAVDKMVTKLSKDVGPMKNVKVNVSPLTGRALLSADNDKRGPVTFMLVLQDDGTWGTSDYFVSVDLDAVIKGSMPKK